MRLRNAIALGIIATALPALSREAQAQTVKVQRMGFHERGGNLTVTTSFTQIFDSKLYRKLASGFVSTLVMRVYVYKKGTELPVAFTLWRARIVYDLWDEVYVVRIDGPRGRTNKRFEQRAQALRAITELRRFPVAKLSDIARGPHYFLGMVVELNPVSRALLAEVRRWLTRKPGKTSLDRTSTFFGSFVSVFVNPKLPEADRVLRLRSQPFYRPRLAAGAGR